ncbi:MAG: N-acetyltransferase [Frankiales bacterium]|nr:N-acetyltransferase [Frankiales bacterium]
MDEEPRVVRNEEQSRFELHVGDTMVGLADYVVDGDRVLFPHTEVDPALNGRGLGTILAREALASVKAEGKRIVPQCAFIALYVRRHADEYAGIVDRH